MISPIQPKLQLGFFLAPRATLGASGQFTVGESCVRIGWKFRSECVNQRHHGPVQGREASWGLAGVACEAPTSGRVEEALQYALCRFIVCL